jgi:hypothetical protein
MQAGERQLHLGLDARRAHDAASCGLSLQVLQQRTFADPGLAAQYK